MLNNIGNDSDCYDIIIYDRTTRMHLGTITLMEKDVEELLNIFETILEEDDFVYGKGAYIRASFKDEYDSSKISDIDILPSSANGEKEVLIQIYNKENNLANGNIVVDKSFSFTSKEANQLYTMVLSSFVDGYMI
jgi:hypothetical protein